MPENQKNWFALKITVDAKASEAVEFALNELDALGTEINNLGVKQAETLSVIGYFNELPDSIKIEAELNEALRIYGFAPGAIHKTDWRVIGNVDWLFEWKKHWKPTETEKFIIAPTWENVASTDKIVIRIEPSMAFGTGTHETTRLCLKAIAENYQGAMSFLDVGMGTGILAIAAAKLKVQSPKSKVQSLESQSQISEFQISDFKAQTENSEAVTLDFGLWTLDLITAYDTDFDSITIAKENAETNEVGNAIEFRVGSISERDSVYDFVCANLTADVIVPLLPLLLEKSKRVLVLSGILNEQKDFIIAKLKDYGIENPKIESLGEWISVLIEKRTSD
jgi:ribosomal protein L11 methyltransferase